MTFEEHVARAKSVPVLTKEEFAALTPDEIQARFKAADPELYARVNKDLCSKLEHHFEFCGRDEDNDCKYEGRYNWGIGLTDGKEMMESYFAELREEGEDIPEDVSYCFCHMQDVETAKALGFCPIAWSGDKEMMVNDFRRHGFHVDPGTPDQRFMVSLKEVK